MEGKNGQYPTSVRTHKSGPRINARKHTQSATGPEGEPFAHDALPLGRILVGDALQTLRRLPDRCVDLVVLDPPYWKVIGEKWDYRWRTQEDYRQWCREWFTEIARVCKRSASLYLFGYVRNLVHVFHDITALDSSSDKTSTLKIGFIEHKNRSD